MNRHITNLRFLHFPSSSVTLSIIPTSLYLFLWFSLIASRLPPLSGLNKSKSKTMLTAELKNPREIVLLIEYEQRSFKKLLLIKRVAFIISNCQKARLGSTSRTWIIQRGLLEQPRPYAATRSCMPRSIHLGGQPLSCRLLFASLTANSQLVKESFSVPVEMVNKAEKVQTRLDSWFYF